MKNKKSFNIVPLIFLFFVVLSLATHFVEHFDHADATQISNKING